MQDIRWNTFWVLLLVSFLSLIIWGFKSIEAASFFFISCLFLYLLSHVYWIYRLNKWLKSPNLSTIPNGSGVWEEIFATLYREYRKQKKSKSELTTTLGRFMTAAEAIPDGIIALNQNNEIEWCNKPSEKMLGIHLAKDINQPINYLLRETSFTEYLNDNKYEGTLKLISWRNTGRSFEILLVPFGVSQKLLICRDITQIEKNDSIKRDFIANVSHELKTPLTVIVGFLETLSDMKNEFNTKTHPYLQMMLEQSDRMKKLVEDLLQLSSIESNAAPAEKKEIDMTQLFKNLKKDSDLVSGKLHKINMSINKNIALLGYEKEIYSAFLNLVSNAIRYTKEGGSIHVIWDIKDQKPYFEVQDSGIGIDERLIPRLTERFFRIDADRSRNTGGTGLGLSIVKHVCIRHQAQIEITSQIGKGSQFKITFPQERLFLKKKINEKNKFYWVFFYLLLSICLSIQISSAKEIVEPDRQSTNQLGKTDFDRMADHEIRENIQSLRTLMIKLYKRNPSELKKSTSDDAEKMVNWVFNGNHNWNFEAINNLQGTDAIYLAFNEDYKGDRVLPFIVGIYTMLIKAHGGKKEFYLFDSVDPQLLYNASRNIETAVWKLSNAKDASGKPFLLTNELTEKENNLSFEREFGKIIGRTDFLAFTLSEKMERSITRVIQNLATGLLIPI